MTRIEVAPEVLDDFDRILEHLAQHDVVDGSQRLVALMQAVDVLASNPSIGRPVVGGMRELIIGRGAQGHVALYRYVAEADTVFLLAVRAQKEAGYHTLTDTP